MIISPSNKTVLAIVGPTASGKSDTAIMIAKQYDGEIVSADSRQVYRGMDIGTGKIPRDTPSETQNQNEFFSDTILHHLIDIADPNQEYNISHFLRDARTAIKNIQSRNHMPIICGGTHFWVQTLLMGNDLPKVSPHPTLRLELSRKTNEELLGILEEQDPDRARGIDPNNTQRLIRALEIASVLGKSPALVTKESMPYETMIIAMNPPREILRGHIEKRLAVRFKQGMIEEVQNLHEHNNVSWERLESFGLEYRYITRFLRQEINEADLRTQLFHESWHYAKRQLSWLHRWERQGTEIHWATDSDQALTFLKTRKENRRIFNSILPSFAKNKKTGYPH